MPGGEYYNPCLMPATLTPVPKPRKQRRKTDHQLRDSGRNPWPILHTLTLQPQQLNSLLVELVSNEKVNFTFCFVLIVFVYLFMFCLFQII